MQSIKELYKVGRGPSSSHTLAPERACRLFNAQFGKADHYEAELFGSLSLTGKGHHTDQVIIDTLPSKTTVIFSLDWKESFPNGFYLRSYDADNSLLHKWTVFSIGGGSIEIKEFPTNYNDEVYKETSFEEIHDLCRKEGISLLDYIYGYEPDLPEYLSTILDAMVDCVERGLHTEGRIPSELEMYRSAHQLYEEAVETRGRERDDLFRMAYAYAASEENAAGHTCITAPTLGACGVMTAFMYDCVESHLYMRDQLINALAIGGLFGNLIKTNATISGAVGGCQAEVGTAVSMTAAAYSYLLGGNIDQNEYAAEIAMEHHLGLTCDPVKGYVMIPCIERNAMGILRAIDAAVLSQYMSRIRRHSISFDMVVRTMNETGLQLPRQLKETAEGGLAKEYEAEEQ